MSSDTMKVTIKAPLCHNGRMLDGVKEQIAAWALVAVRNGKMEQPITARFWMSRSGDGASPVYCSIWAHAGEYSLAGHGNARGYGYHKKSAALQAALRSAGATLSHPIDGRGEGAMRDALSALARAIGFRKFLIVEL